MHETPLRLHDTSADEFDAIRGIVPSQDNLWIKTTTNDAVKSWIVIDSGTQLALVSLASGNRVIHSGGDQVSE